MFISSITLYMKGVVMSLHSRFQSSQRVATAHLHKLSSTLSRCQQSLLLLLSEIGSLHWKWVMPGGFKAAVSVSANPTNTRIVLCICTALICLFLLSHGTLWQILLELGPKQYVPEAWMTNFALPVLFSKQLCEILVADNSSKMKRCLPWHCLG